MSKYHIVGNHLSWLILFCRMIGLQLGTLVAQVVIIGDLGPAILSKATGLPVSSNLCDK